EGRARIVMRHEERQQVQRSVGVLPSDEHVLLPGATAFDRESSTRVGMAQRQSCESADRSVLNVERREVGHEARLRDRGARGNAEANVARAVVGGGRRSVVSMARGGDGGAALTETTPRVRLPT